MNSIVLIENSRMFFEKITSEKGSIMVLYQINVTIFVGAVIFQNNTSLACNDWNSWNSCDPSAIMLLRQSTAYIYHSNISFFKEMLLTPFWCDPDSLSFHCTLQGVTLYLGAWNLFGSSGNI